MRSTGCPEGAPVILLHGFPYDVRAYDEVAPALAADGSRVLVPYLRGYGPTRFLLPDTLRSGEQAALGHRSAPDDGRAGHPSAPPWRAMTGAAGRPVVVCGACGPERVRCLVSCTGLQPPGHRRPRSSRRPAVAEHRLWYQYYFNTERGRAGLTQEPPADICGLLWKLWSPHWKFDDATFAKTQRRPFDNLDFVEVVIHPYRHRYGYMKGDPARESLEAVLAKQPAIVALTINLHGAADGVGPASDRDGKFRKIHQRLRAPWYYYRRASATTSRRRRQWTPWRPCVTS